MKKLEIKELEMARSFEMEDKADGVKSFVIGDDGGRVIKEHATYIDLITSCIDELPIDGRGQMTTLAASELRKRSKLLDKFDDKDKGNTVYLEDEEATLLKSLVNAKRWSMPPSKSKEVLVFIDDVENMEDFVPEEAKK